MRARHARSCSHRACRTFLGYEITREGSFLRAAICYIASCKISVSCVFSPKSRCGFADLLLGNTKLGGGHHLFTDPGGRERAALH